MTVSSSRVDKDALTTAAGAYVLVIELAAAVAFESAATGAVVLPTDFDLATFAW